MKDFIMPFVWGAGLMLPIGFIAFLCWLTDVNEAVHYCKELKEKEKNKEVK